MNAYLVRSMLRVFSHSVVAATLLLGVSGCWIVSAQSSGGTTLANNTPGFIKNGKDLGEADLSSMIAATVWLKLHNENLMDRLVKDQYNPKSPGYHKWISQDDFNKNFSPTSQEVKAVQNFLTGHGLAVIEVAENNFYVKVQGTIADMEKTFHVSIHNFSFKGQTLRSNTSDPSVSNGVGGQIAAVTGLDDLGFEPLYALPTDPEGATFPMRAVSVTPQGVFFEGQCFRGVQTKTFTNAAAKTSATYTGNRYGADITNTQLGHLPPCGYQPAELQTAYGLNPLYQAGLDGSGETIVIVDAYGSNTIAGDADVFSQVYGLPRITSENFQIVKAPGLVNNPKGPLRNWTIETTLDVEWAHAMAPGAKIALVTATDHGSLDEAINLAVVRHLGNTISNSWSTIEGLGNPARLNRVERILQQAAVQGIDVNFASGDFGDESIRVGFLSVDYPASSPFATGIGGTSLALNPDDSIAFQTGWGNNLTRIAESTALSHIPVVPPLHLGFQGGAGGGSSLTFAKPAFQSGLAGPTRQVPDVSMVADAFTGVEFIETINGQLSVGVVGGTSLATPLFSGVMAIAAQKNGHAGLGQAAALLYSLPAGAVTDVAPFTSAGNVTGTITVNGTPTNFSAPQLAAPLENTTDFYSALYNSPFSTRWFVITFGTDSSLVVTPGWDNVTGVGTPNGAAFVNAIAP
jgi:subtilase family serine protease